MMWVTNQALQWNEDLEIVTLCTAMSAPSPKCESSIPQSLSPLNKNLVGNGQQVCVRPERSKATQRRELAIQRKPQEDTRDYRMEVFIETILLQSQNCQFPRIFPVGCVQDASCAFKHDRSTERRFPNHLKSGGLKCRRPRLFEGCCGRLLIHVLYWNSIIETLYPGI